MYTTLLIDDPKPSVKRITLNRPDKRNAINNEMRKELFETLAMFDRDDSVRVTIIRGAGKCFSSGYDLASDLAVDQPYASAPGDGAWSRHVTEGWFGIWDLAKPVIAQVHGYAMAGGSELATACDLVYLGENTKIGYPVTRVLSPPDMQFHPWLVGMRKAMELMLTGDAMVGEDAVAAGFANQAFAEEMLDESVLAIAEKIAGVAPDLNQLNKRSVHRAMEVMGARTAMRAGSELMALATHQASTKAFLENALSAMKAENKHEKPD
ncbi:Putative enoyl-CoA hydratase EchA13 [BD1-7 clade bacterium]|uniref:Enoyl-CoA hydratase EchA13 n=1 Tax=BD1-7 clade bacterium TaxID=2029982 RepID=A0A5S9R195_9GAMM|nr:Putative enoyl-CoA hydratase EchA13 [BD1-7 clade bacterium]